MGLFPCCWAEIMLLDPYEKYRGDRIGKSSLALPLPRIPMHHIYNDLQKNPTEEVQRDVMNTGNVVSWHAASNSHFTHTCTFISLCALLWILSFSHLQIKSVLTLEGLIPGRQILKHLALEESLCLGFSTKVFALDVHLSDAEGDENILCEGRVE